VSDTVQEDALPGDDVPTEPDVPEQPDTADALPDVADDADEPIPDTVDDTGGDTGPGPPCTTDDDCDDGDPCTVGTCEPRGCIYRARDCAPDGADPCDDWFCNPVTGTCDVYENANCPPLCMTNLATCDDGNPCTVHSCDPVLGCQYAVADTDCSDGNPCTVGDRCVPDPTGGTVAVCAPGSARSCDDGDECTINWCDPTFPEDLACRSLQLEGLEGDCSVIPCPDGDDDECPVVPNPCVAFKCNAEVGVCEIHFPENSCDDNNPCTTNDRCEAGACVGGPPPDCDDGIFCTVDSCVPERGGCVNTPIVDCRKPCDTADDCPTSTNPCVRPVCTPGGQCYEIALTGSCDNGNPCTQQDYCENRRCVAGPAVNCDDFDICTRDYCDPARGGCINELIPECRAGGPCDTGADCEDGDPCTIDSCLTYLDPPTCYYLPRPFCSCNPNAADGGHGACDRGNPCLVSRCERNTDPDLPYIGLCSPVQYDAELCCEQPCDPDNNTCDDGDKCTLDLCEPGAIVEGVPTYCCIHPPIESLVCGRPCTEPGQESLQCDDGDPCTVDRCGADGTCDAPLNDPALCECSPGTALVDCAHLEDENFCTDVGCQNRQCVVVNHTRACDDGDFCTINTFCSGGECVGEPRICESEEPCHDATCDPLAGCVWTWNYEREGCADTRCSIDAQCDEGGPCQEGRCVSGACQYFDLNEGQSSPVCKLIPCSEPVHCDDGNPCTTGTCVSVDDLGMPLPLNDRVCIFEKEPGCVSGPAFNCMFAAECEPAVCQPEYPSAFCFTAGACVEKYCDPDIGCRFLASATCPFDRECEPGFGYIDCWDQDPCTQDICTPDGVCDNTLPVYPADENLLPLCMGCFDAGDCEVDGVVDPALQACLQVHCRQFEPLNPGDEESGLGVCWAELPIFDPADNLWEGCQPCSLDMPCDPSGQAFLVDNPCATYHCRQFPLQVPFGGRSTVGVCWAELDEEQYPNLCEDYDLCTVNTCMPDGTCLAEPWSDDCRICGTDSDCDDRNACTLDECVDNGFRCTHTPVEACNPCNVHTDCPAGDGCDLYQCVDGVCEQIFRDAEFAEDGGFCLPLGCDVIEGLLCDDGDPNTFGFCLQGSGDCAFFERGEECVPELCWLESGSPCNELPECVNGACTAPVVVPGCVPVACASQADCNTDSPARSSLCLNGYCWGLDGPPCERHADCASDDRLPRDACTVPVCELTGTCSMVSFGSKARCGGEFCESDADCAPGPWSAVDDEIYTFCLTDPEGAERCYNWPCSKGRCAIQAGGLNTCVWFEGDCRQCTNDGDCNDGDPCTTGSCQAGRCEHTPIANCTPTACGPGNPCLSDDLCLIGICVSDGCVWLPNPLCD
jgi:hypothetical protein